MMSQKVVIVDYKMGNLHSVARRLEQLQIAATVSDKFTDLLAADKIVLPGVGHFGKAMQNLRQLNLLDALHEAVLVKKKPVLGICLGMQLMASHSEEGDTEGLGWIHADVVKFAVSDTLTYKVPHTGWNQVIISKKSLLMSGINNMAEFYFVHSFHMDNNEPADILNTTEYAYSFVSAVEKENIFGVQYHPEKSHDAGRQLLKNFIAL